jgi:cysteine-rich repeat protein
MLMRRGMYWVVCAVVLMGCSSTGGTDTGGADAQDQWRMEEAVDESVSTPEVVDLRTTELAQADQWVFDVPPDVPYVGCDPGEGCFLDPCNDSSNCQSGWCVEHMGEGVCTQLCSEECPPGWTCSPVGSGPDLTFLCVSSVANLCKPCATTEGCKAPGGAENVCVDYGEEGSFCGGVCTTSNDCPWGFSCLATVTVDGIDTLQCVADAGVCPCTGKSTELALSTPCEETNEFGTCEGKRYCGKEGLTVCDALVPSEETCNGIDDNCDGIVDQDTCDDSNACTEDTCHAADGCQHEALDTGECFDGNPCTVADHCDAGECIGTPALCNDNNPCTEDGCDESGGCIFTENTVKCDDGDVCTVGDVCEAGVCAGYSVNCQCNAAEDCTALEDGDLCNGTLECDTSSLPHQCIVKAGTEVVCPQPEGLAAICQAAACNPDSGECSITSANEGYACDDEDMCTIGDSCDGGLCVGGVAPNCDDSNPCTDDDCNADSGCTHVFNNIQCNDGNACTSEDQCAQGQCLGSKAVNCDDNNPCTADSCSPLIGCEHTIAAAPCDDGNPCTINDSCVNGECVAGELVNCDDSNPCTDDSCDNGLCKFTPNEADCDDGNECTMGDHCAAGACVKSGLVECDDDNICTTDSCDPDSGCIHLLNNAPCDDGNLCTTSDLCQLGECGGSDQLNCNDGNDCTDDACSPQVGCTFTPNQNGCDDGNACTTVDSCNTGSCKGSAPAQCSDNNVCTEDLCDALLGCIHVNNSDSCSDGNACTAEDLCQGGECLPGLQIVCADDNGCTDDGCVPDTGCVFLPNTDPCDDGSACTANDECGEGICDGDEVLCNDDNACTTDSCLPETGCLYAPIPDCCGNGIKEGGEECDDGNAVSDDGCSAQCKSENSSGCTDGTADQIFQQSTMVGCNGNYLGTQLTDACGPGWHPANPNEYFTYGGKSVQPDQKRWVDTAWDSQGKDVPMDQFNNYYDCSNGPGWNGVCVNPGCTWVSMSQQCYLTFVNHDYGQSYGCHCDGGHPESTHHGVICVNDSNALPRL